MSTPNSSPVPANLEQQRKLAKDLIRAARARRSGGARAHPGSSPRRRPLRRDRSSSPMRSLPSRAKAGFESWPKLVADLQERDVKAFCDAVRGGDIPGTQRLLALAHVRKRINDPMFAFGQRAAHIAAKNETMLSDADRRRRRREPEKRLGERPLHRARQRQRGHRAIPPGARGDTDAERGGAPRLARRAAGARGRRRSARSRAGRRRSAAAPRGEDRRDCRLPAGSRRGRRCALYRSQVHARAVRAGRSPGRLPASTRARRHARHLHGGPPRGHRAGNPPAGRRSGLRRRSHQRARVSAGPALQHLLLVDRLRHVSARGRVEVRSSRCPRSARGPKPGTDPIHQRPLDRGRARGERRARRGSVAARLL